ncbi:hypothetical protein BDB00DRAFT_826913 [Zychaea mexicana]|uniref:uncharacterized protein n=1 Tax=Zychaea mexicana TaxID=64656 RepID=UPI0022FE885C|nr:uncharacterized protein BDB00DRAFT_826913 [Zychaea mexicana]KAI9492720.1 hypothetical protein BDB00DRAFT_826913 [Zychaea mexicana]
MPKIVSSSIVSSSDHTGQLEDQRHLLHVYYCLCSEFLLVIDADLRKLPRRRTDNAIIVSNTRRTYKFTAESDGCTIVKRREGFEKQYRYHCPRCRLLVAYEMNENKKSGPYTYIVDSALTEKQGSAPPNAIQDIPTPA